MKPVSVQKVSAVLKKASFPKAQRLTGGRYTDDITIASDPSGRPQVLVRYGASQVPMMVVSVMGALRGAGIESIHRDGISVICTGIKEEN